MRKHRWRRAFDLLAMTSLVLLVAASALCVSSFFVAGWINISRSPKSNVFVGSARGTLVLKRNAIEGPTEAALVPVEDPAFTLPEADTLHVRAGPGGQLAFVAVTPSLRPCWFGRIDPVQAPRLTIRRADGTWLTVTGRMDQFAVNYLLLMVASAILPALWWYLRHQRKRRLVEGRCLSCGYDLRVTPNRCPECGGLTPSPSRVPM